MYIYMYHLSDMTQGCADNKFGPSETKLLYTLHWIILDAASECEDADAEFMALNKNKGSGSHMHSLSTVQLFVYLFAPLVHLLKVSCHQCLHLLHYILTLPLLKPFVYQGQLFF